MTRPIDAGLSWLGGSGPELVVRSTESTATAARSVKAGQFVEWPASKGTSRGKVISVHTGKVPGTATKVEGSSLRPAARVQLYAKAGDGWQPTTVYLGHHTDELSAIAELPAPATEAIVAGSFDDIRQDVQTAVRTWLGSLVGKDDVFCYVCDLGPSWAVYSTDYGDDYWLIDYTRADDGTITLGDAVQVKKVTTYEPATEAAVELRDVVTSRLLEAKGVDAAGNRVYAVQLIAYGESKNARRYPEAVLRAAVPMYEGAKAYDHHRTDAELKTSTIVGLVGHYRNVEATATGLAAELHLLPSAKHTAECIDQSLANQAAGLPPLVGLSHDVLTLARPVVTDDGRQIHEAAEILSVNSTDVVADPAAGGAATRMVAGGTGAPVPEEDPVKFKQLLELLRGTEAAQRPALLTEHAVLIESFGLTADEINKMVETAPAPAPTATQATEAKPTTPAATRLVKGELVTRMVAAAAISAAKLPEQMTEAILAELPDHFTEAELNGKIESVKRMAEGLEKLGLRPTVPSVEVGQEAFDKMLERLDATFAGDTQKGFRSFKEAYYAVTGKTPSYSYSGVDENRLILQESVTLLVEGQRVPFTSSLLVERGSESVQASTWGNILGDAITRRMVAEYNQPSLQAWRAIVSSIFTLTDFRTQRIQRLGGYGTLPTVLEGGPYQPLPSPGNDAEVTYQPSKKGGTEDLTYETIANDDLRAIQRIPQKLGLAAAQTLYRFVFDILATNPTIFDSVALFASGHANTDTNALSGANVSVGRKKMRKQTAYGDATNVLSITPKFLITCSDLEELAWELCTSAVALPSGAPVGAATNVPNIHQGLTPIVVDYWSSTTAWDLVADPALVPTIEIGFLNGRQDPELFVQNDPSTGSVFNADKVTYKIRHIYGGAVLDYRGFYRGNS